MPGVPGQQYEVSKYEFKRFDALDPETLQGMPRLRTWMERQGEITEQHIRTLTDKNGLFRAVVSRATSYKFSEPALQLAFKYIDERTDALQDEIEEYISTTVPYYEEGSSNIQDLDELREFYGASDIWTCDYINGILEEAYNYKTYRSIWESSEPVAWLKSRDAEYRWDRDRLKDQPILVVPDKKLATYIKLTWG